MSTSTKVVVTTVGLTALAVIAVIINAWLIA